MSIILICKPERTPSVVLFCIVKHKFLAEMDPVVLVVVVLVVVIATSAFIK